MSAQSRSAAVSPRSRRPDGADRTPADRGAERLSARRMRRIEPLAATHEHAAEPTRRDFIFIATGAVAAVGTAAAIWPFISQMSPDAATIAAGAPVEVPIQPIPVGQEIKIFWRGKPIYIRHRTPEEIKAADDVDVASLRDPQTDAQRVKEGKAE